MSVIDRETVKMYAYDKIGYIKESDQRKRLRHTLFLTSLSLLEFGHDVMQ